jgi:UDP-glucose 4-epimerase
VGNNTRNIRYKVKYLVTGGAGFIGSNLVDKLISLGHDVICIDDESAECHEQFYWNNKAQNYKYDICNYDLIAPLFEGVDCVFHVASDARIQPAILNPKKSIQSNAVGTANVLELCRVNKVDRLIYSSTSSAYGKKALLPNQEIQPSDPLTPYSAAKVFGENLARVYFNLYGLKTISLRYFNVYGDRQPLKGQYAPVIGLFLKQKREGRSLTIVGDGSQRRDFTHISDVVHANLLASEVTTGFGEVYNIGYGINYSILEIANIISNDIKFIPSRIGEVQETLSSNQKFKDLTGWNPKVSLIEWLSK